jgi:hypothetical protein
VPEDDAALDLDRVIDEIRDAVAAKTAAGAYSDSIDDELRSHVTRRREQRDTVAAAAVFDALGRLGDRSAISQDRIDLSSGLPGGRLAHRATGALVSRQIDGLSEQFNEFTAELLPALHALAALATDAAAHGHADLVHELDAIQDRLAAVERSARRLQGIVEEAAASQHELIARVERLERALGER